MRGAALEFGGSIGGALGKLFKLDENDRRVIVMCGMSAAFSALFGTPMAAVGMTAFFCAVTNCPITAMLIGFELFGFAQVKFMLVAVSVSYMLSGYYSIYSEQTIVYSKFKTIYINRKAR